MSPCLYFIPARGGSKRFPRKNIAPLEGKPLIAHVIDSLRAADPAGRIVVSTEDEGIRAAVENHGAKAGISGLQVDLRPSELGGDTASVGQVLKDYLERARPAEESCFCAYATAALLSSETIRAAVARFRSDPKIRSLMGASEYNLHPWQALYRASDGYFVPYFPELYRKKAQEFPRFYASNGSFYLVRTREFTQIPDFYAAPLELFPVSEEEAVDVDYPDDLLKLERILRWKREK
jgi:pseudaminic acid cytidylyltransferase